MYHNHRRKGTGSHRVSPAISSAVFCVRSFSSFRSEFILSCILMVFTTEESNTEQKSGKCKHGLLYMSIRKHLHINSSPRFNGLISLLSAPFSLSKLSSFSLLALISSSFILRWFTKSESGNDGNMI